MRRKTIIGLILAFCIIVGVIGVLPVSAATYTGSCGANVTYTLNTNTGVLTISGSGAMADYGEYYNYAPWYNYTSYIKSVTIGNNVTSIGNHALRNCTGLTKATIGDSVTSIGDGAFYGCSSLTSVTIPDSVKSIGDSAFYWNRSLTSVTIGEGVTSIGNDAFSDCGSLTSVEIPDNVISIGSDAFYGCYGLTSVTIGNSVTSIGELAFEACSGLTEIIVDANNAYYCSVDGVLFNKNKTTLVKYPAGKTNSTYTIPDSVTSIGYYAFVSCNKLTDVTIPDSVTSIDSYAFYNCSSLTSVTIGDSVTSIGSNAFLGCRKLTSVTIPGSVTSIGSYAFDACGSLTDVYYNGTEEKWNAISINSGNDCLTNANIHIILLTGECGENVTFVLDCDGILAVFGTGAMEDYLSPGYVPWCNYRSYIKSVTISDDVTSIGESAFEGCSNLASVTLPNSVTSIGYSAFLYCSGLTSVTIPDGVTNIGDSAFYGCSSLTSVTIPNSVVSIEDSAFSYCSSLTSVTIPDSVTSIGSFAFNACSSLTSVTIPDSVTSIEDYTFSNCSNLTSVTIPDSVITIGNNAFISCTGLTDVYYNGTIVEWAEISINSGNECLINAMLHTEPLTGECGEKATFKLENNGTLTISGTGAMADYAAATDAPWAEYATDITKIIIEDGVTTVGARAFYGLSNVTEVEIADSVTVIGTNAFRNCTSLTEISLPAGVTELGTYAFSGCSALARVDMGSKVESIGNFAFYNCKALTDVYYDGSQEEWDDVSIGNFNTGLTSATIHVKDVAEVIIDGVAESYATFTEAFAVAEAAGKAIDVKLLTDIKTATVAPTYKHIVDLNGHTVAELCVTGEINLTNGTVTNLDVTGIVTCENVTVTSTNAVSYNVEGNKSVYSSYKVTITIDGVDSSYNTIADAMAVADEAGKAVDVKLLTNAGEVAIEPVYAHRIDLNGYTVDTFTVTGEINLINGTVTNLNVTGVVKCENVTVTNTNAVNYSIEGTKSEYSSYTVTITIDGVDSSYNTIADAIAAADNAGKAVDVKLIVNADEVAIEPEYAHTIDLNRYTVDTFTVTGDVNLTNGTITMLNVTGIVKCENVAVTGTNAVSYGSEGTKSVYTAYGIGANVVDGAQVRIGNGLVNGTIDAESGLRFIGQADMNDTLAGAIVENYYTDNAYITGYAIGIEISAQDSDKKAYIQATKWQDDAGSIFSAAITGLYANNFNRNYTARAYVEYDGVKIFESGSTTRSMYAVASGLLMSNRATTEELFNVLNAYVNQTGVRLTLTKENEFSARMSGQGAYTGEAFFTVGETMYEEGMYMVTLTPIGQAKIDVDLFNSYVRINNNNSLVSPATFIMDNEDGTYTIVFDYSSL